MSQTMASKKAAEKQERILRVAIEVFARDGFRSTDVQDIADLAEVGKGTVYRHFGSKEQLFLAAARQCVNELMDSVSSKIGPAEELNSIVEKCGLKGLLKQIARTSAEYYQDHPDAVEIAIQERAEFRSEIDSAHRLFQEQLKCRFADILQAGVERGELRHPDASHIGNAFRDLFIGSLVNNRLEEGETNLVERVETGISLLLEGLVIDPPNESKQ